MELRKEAKDLHRANIDLSDKIYAKQIDGDMLQRDVVMKVQHESDLKDITSDNQKKIVALRLEYGVKLADEMTSSERFSKELATIGATYKQKELEVELVQAELAAAA